MTFGELLRQSRGRITMGQLARHLGLSVPYICDVELGRRPPLADKHLAAAARYLKVDEFALRFYAAEGRGYVSTEGMDAETLARVVRMAMGPATPANRKDG